MKGIVAALIVWGLAAVLNPAASKAGWASPINQSLAATEANPLGADVHGDAAGSGSAEPTAPTGVVGKATVPSDAVNVLIQPRLGVIQMTTAGKKTVQLEAPIWQWPTPTLTMASPAVVLGGHAPVWRAWQIMQSGGVAGTGGAGNAGGGSGALPGPPPSAELLGSGGQQKIAAATLAWHRAAFADPAKLAALIARVNARDAAGHSQAIQFYFHTIELGVIDPQGGPGQTAAYSDCYVAVEAKPILCGGGYEAEPMLVEHQPVKEVQAKYWKDCGFAEPIQEHFEFTTIKSIKLQVPIRHRNFLGLLHWLNGDWLDINPDPEVAAVPPVASLAYGSEAEFVAALEAIRTQFKAKQPQLTLVKISPNLKERLQQQYSGQSSAKE